MSQIEDRIQAIVKHHSRPRWYRLWWGKTIIFCGIIFLVLVAVFVALVIYNYQLLVNGDANGTSAAQLQAERIKALQNSNDPSVGPATAPITVVAFEDFECPFCKAAQPFIRKLLVKYNTDVRFVFKDFPLTAIHPHAQEAAEAGQCAFEQGKFWEFHDELFANQDKFALAYYRTVAKNVGLNITQFNECVSSGKYRKQIADDIALGRSLSVQGTPTFFINGELFAAGYGPEIDAPFEQAIEYIKGL